MTGGLRNPKYTSEELRVVDMEKGKGRLAVVSILVLLAGLVFNASSCQGKGEKVPTSPSGTDEQSGEMVEQEVDELMREIDSLLDSLDPGAFDESDLSDQELGM